MNRDGFWGMIWAIGFPILLGLAMTVMCQNHPKVMSEWLWGVVGSWFIGFRIALGFAVYMVTGIVWAFIGFLGMSILAIFEREPLQIPERR